MHLQDRSDRTVRRCQCICRTVQTEILERLQRAANVLSFTKKKVLRL